LVIRGEDLDFEEAASSVHPAKVRGIAAKYRRAAGAIAKDCQN